MGNAKRLEMAKESVLSDGGYFDKNSHALPLSVGKGAAAPESVSLDPNWWKRRGRPDVLNSDYFFPKSQSKCP